MTQDDFEAQLRHYRWQEPFHPLTIELVTGERIEIDRTDGLAFSGGFGVFDAGDELYEFGCEEVARITSAQDTPAA